MGKSRTRGEKREDAVKGMSPKIRKRARMRAGGVMYLIASAVTQQTQRLQADRRADAEYMADGWLFAECVRAALRAGELCALLADPTEVDAVRDALREFSEAIPDATDVRDALEHFDDYLLGVGNQQQTRPDDAFIHAYSRGKQHAVWVGSLGLTAETAEEAVNRLADVAIGCMNSGS